MHINQHSESRKMKKQENMFQTKGQNKLLETDLDETDIYKCLLNNSKITVRKMFSKVRKGMHKQSENIQKYQTEITELENTITEKFSRRLPQQAT